MLKLFSFCLTGLVLTGCSFPAYYDDSEDVSQLIAQEEANDEYYLKIAKDLYTAQQYTQAYQITSKLAEKNNPAAQYLLGYLTYYGQGVTADKEQGTKLIQIAADAGYRPAIEGLVMINHGLTPDNKCEPVFIETQPRPAPVENSEQIIITPTGQKKYTGKAGTDTK